MQIRELKRNERDYELGYRYEVQLENNGRIHTTVLCHTLEEVETCIGAEVYSYYCVYQRYADGTADTVKISTVYATQKPENTFKECEEYDEYHDYFESYTDAKALWDDFKRTREKQKKKQFGGK